MTISRASTRGTATPAVVSIPPFAVISGSQVQRALQGKERQIVDLVEATYRLHGAGDSVNPPSYFLRFPDRPSARIIALPASLGGDVRVDGLKWISSFPENVAAGNPRGPARPVFHDPATGPPFPGPRGPRFTAPRKARAAESVRAARSRARDAERPARRR